MKLNLIKCLNDDSGKKIKKVTRAVTLTLSAPLLLTSLLTGCRDADVAVGVGYGGVSAYDPYYPGYTPGYYPGYYPNDYYPGGSVIIGGGGWGRGRDGGHWGGGRGGGHWGGGHGGGFGGGHGGGHGGGFGGGHGGGGHGGGHRFSAVELRGTAPDQSVQHFATTFKMPVQQSQLLKNVLQASAQGHPETLAQLGLTAADTRALTEGRQVSTSSIVQMSKVLQQDPNDTTKMLQYLEAETQRQAKDSSSPLWQRCVNSRAWTTPQNAFCQSSSWPGCGVETGATFCIPTK